MRNLKKVLALVLAMMMTLSLMVTANAASYKDDASISKDAAVEVMSALKVFNGLEDGNFHPTGTLTRAQAAKIISYLQLGAENAEVFLDNSVGSKYSDVTAGKWYTGYVNYCDDMGIIAGANGKFRPNDNVTGYEFAKMLLTAIGYDAKIEGYQDTGRMWTLNVGRQGKLIGLDNNVAYSSAALTREEACQMAYNVIFATMVKYNKDGDRVEIEASKDVPQTLATSVFNLLQASGRVVVIGEKTRVGGTTYAISSDPSVLGHNVTVYYQNDKDKTGYALVDNSTTLTLTGTAKTDNEALAKALDVETATVPTAALTIFDSSSTSTTSQSTNAALPADSAKAGYQLIIDSKADGTLEVTGAVKPTVYTLSKVNSVSKDGYPVLNRVATLNKDNTGSLYADIAKNDYVVVYNIGTKYFVSKAETVVGTASSFNAAGTVTIGGNSYAYNAANNKSGLADNKVSSFSTEYTLYLDGQGNYFTAVAATPDAAPTSLVYFVAGYSVSAGTDAYGRPTGTKYMAQCVDANGETVEYQLARQLGTGTKEDGTWNAPAGLYQTGSETVNNNKYTTLTPARASDVVEDGETLPKQYVTLTVGENGVAATATRLPNASGSLTTNYYDSSVKFIYVDGILDKLTVTVKDGRQALAAGDQIVYTVEGEGTNKLVKTVYFLGAWEEPEVLSSSIMFGNEAENSTTSVPYTDKDGKVQVGFQHTVYIDGVETTITTDSADKIVGFQSFSENNGFYTVKASKAENVFNTTEITNMFNGVITTKDVTDLSVANATVVDMTGEEGVPTDPVSLTVGSKVALVLNADKNEVVSIYVIEFVAAE